jgi:hypothetical protein
MSRPGIAIGQPASRTNANVPTVRYYVDADCCADTTRHCNIIEDLSTVASHATFNEVWRT